MNSLAKIEKEARKLCTHTVVFTDLTEKMIAVRAMQGRSTKAIAQEFGITDSKAQYRILKAQKSLNTRFRRDYRNGDSKFAKRMLKATEQIGLAVVEKQITPQFLPLARDRFANI